jgi:hypothetical protein
MKSFRLFTFILLIFPVFSLTKLLRLPHLNNVIFLILVIGLFYAFLKKPKIAESSIYSWIIGLGLLTSVLYQSSASNDFSYVNFVFPLVWLFFPFFIAYWESIKIDRRQRFCDLFFFLNFTYAYIQIFLVRFLGYSLLLHKFPPTDYVIVQYSQDTPFSWLGLMNIHQIISSYIGTAVTGLVTERVDLMLICILCLLRLNLFNYSFSEEKIPKNKSDRLIYRFNFLSAIILLSISGSSLSIFIILLPLISILIYISEKSKYKFKFFRLKLSSNIKAFKNILLGLFFILLFFFALIPFFVEMIVLLDQSTRISAIVNLSDALSRFSENLDLVFFGSEIISTQSLEGFGIGETNSLLSRSLDIVGYTFNSFGLFGLVPFLICYPLLLSSITLLRNEAIALFCLLAFVAAGSPINYVYVYAIILSWPRQLSFFVKI